MEGNREGRVVRRVRGLDGRGMQSVRCLEGEGGSSSEENCCQWIPYKVA